MSADAVVALVVALIALAGVLFQEFRRVKLERERSRLTREETLQKAKLEYEYEARKRLYQRFEPLTFQLMQRAEFALERISELTDPEIWSEFRYAEGDDQGRAEAEHRTVMAAASYPLVSTLYGLLSPLVVVRFMSRELTLVDLSLDERIEIQFHLGSRAYGALKDDAVLAAKAPPLAYRPFAAGWRKLRESRPAEYWWQGLTMGRLETGLDLLTVRSGEGNAERLKSFGEFERTYRAILDGPDALDRKSLAATTNPLLRFRPEDRPIYCRVLMVQARLYSALLRTRRDDFVPPATAAAWEALLGPRGSDRLAWDDAHGAAVDAYLRAKVISPWMTAHDPDRAS